MRRAVVILFLVTGAMGGAIASSAAAATPTELAAVADELRADPLFVDPDAERALSADDAEQVRSAIRDAGTPVYIAVLPASVADAAGGDPAEVARQLAANVARPGTYGAIVGESFRAGSSELADGDAGRLVDDALQQGGDDTTAVLVAFVDLVGEADQSTAATGEDQTSTAASGTDSDGGTGWVLPVVLAVAVVVAAAFLWQWRKRRQAAAAERARADEADRQLLRAELSVLADDVLRLEPEVQLHPDAQRDYDAAVNRYQAAQAALEYADQPVDLVRVERVVLEGRYSMDRARAIVDGREPPPPPDALAAPGRHGEPAITLDDQRQPSYVGYPGGFQSGWYGGGSGLFSGLLIGSMLGGGFGGWGHGDTTVINEDGGGGGDFGGGDFGGGDFGGGDFGGGDFGGGDF